MKYVKKHLLLLMETVGIIHNELYSVNCVHIACSSKNITVVGSPRVFDERILYMEFFHTMHSISLLGSWRLIQSNLVCYYQQLIK